MGVQVITLAVSGRKGLKDPNSGPEADDKAYETGLEPHLVPFIPKHWHLYVYQRDPEVVFGPSGFLKAWGAKDRKPRLLKNIMVV